jgi:hypothetical protein
MHGSHPMAIPLASPRQERTERRPPPALRFVLAFLFAATALLAFAALRAQPVLATEATATSMTVSVQPEFDDPRVLVVNQATLDPNLQLPANVTFNVPKGAEIGMACEVDANGGHACKAYQTVDRGDYQSITYPVEKEHTVFLEYYYQAFSPTATKRLFTFTFHPGFPANSLEMSIQEPLRATGFKLSPAFPKTTTDQQGMTNYVKDFSGVAPGKPISVKVSYSKPDHKTSVAPKDKSAQGDSSSSLGRSAGGSNRYLLILLVIGVFGALMLGGYKLFRPLPATGNRGGRRNGRRAGNAPRPRQEAEYAVAKAGRGNRGSGRSPQPRRSPKVTDTKFCTSCGCQLRAADSFCAECGGEQA